MSVAYEELCNCQCCERWEPLLASATQERDQLQARALQAETKVIELKERVAELSEKLNEKLAWEERRERYDGLDNQNVPPLAKLIAFHFDQEAERWRAEGRTGPQQINTEDLGKRFGFGVNATRAALRKLEKAGKVRLSKGDPFSVTKGNGREISIQPTLVEVVGNEPEDLEKGSSPRIHGGDRTCPNCGKDAGTIEEQVREIRHIRRTTKKTRVTCKGCGHCIREIPHEKPEEETLDLHEGPLSPQIQIESGTGPESDGTVDEPGSHIQLGGLNHTGGDIDPLPPIPALLVLSVLPRPRRWCTSSSR